MPKTLPIIAAVAVIAFSIGFNVARYPTVWEMVDTAACVSAGSVCAESATTLKPAKTDESAASTASDNPAGTPLAESKIPDSVLPDRFVSIKAEPAGADPSRPSMNLVPVPGDLVNDNGSQSGELFPGVQRLPPVYETAPIPAGRYADEYPQSPIPIYPNTGME